MKKLTKAAFKKELITSHKAGLDLSIEVKRLHIEYPSYSQLICKADLEVTTAIMFGEI